MPDAGPSRTLEVALRERSYPIHVGAGQLAHAGRLLAGHLGAHAVIVTNALVARHWLAPLRDALAAYVPRIDVVSIADGETHKDMATLGDVLTRLIECNAERRSLVIALGGGVVGDVAGFAAAIYQRGIAYVQVPTTLLAQVDSSVGGKTAVNHALGKNMVGAFWQPQAVIADTLCLATLSAREYRSGLAEVVKYGAMADAAFFTWLETHAAALGARDTRTLDEAIYACCRIKADIVARDEREDGERAHLNFGHTFGHAIETGTGYGEWTHGEAVAAGMVLAAELSVRINGLPRADAARLAGLLRALDIRVAPPSMDFDRWLSLMRRDKKVRDSAIRFVLLDRLGRATLRGDVAEVELRAVLGSLVRSSR